MASRKKATTKRPKIKEEEHQEPLQDELISEEGSSKKVRQDNSLSVLTRKFVKLIKSEQNQTIDLNSAVGSLSVQKRRIYDITNVLEGIGYVQKLQKNTIKWMGQSEDLDNEREIRQLLSQLNSLVEIQRKLNEELDSINREITTGFLQNESLRKYQYITLEDCSQIAKAYCRANEDEYGKHQQDNTLVILSAPHGSTLEAQEEGDGSSQLIMSAGKGQIKVYLADSKGQVRQYKAQ